MKKVLSKALTLLAVLAMIGSFTACGKKESKKVISIYRCTFNLASPDATEVQKVQDAINAYLAKKGADYTVELNDIGSGEYTDKANLALKGGEVNLLWTASWESTIGTNDLWKENSAYDITNLIKGTDLEKALPSWVWPASAYAGKTYYVPCYKESAEGYDVMVRSDLAKKYNWNLNSIKTLKDIEPMLADCKAEGLKYPYLTQKTAMFHRWYLNDFDFFSQDSFIAVDRDTNTVVDAILTPEYADFCKLMGNWHAKGYIHEDDPTKQTTDTTTQTQDWGFSWWTCVPNDEEADSRYGQSVETISVTNKYSHSTTTLGSCFAIAANCTEDEARACIDFLGKLYTDKELADLYTYGIEGTDYTRTASGAVKKQGGKYNHSMWESASVLCLSLEDGEPADKVELYSKFNNSSLSSCASGFRFDSTPVAAEYATCQTVFEEYGFILENGGIAPADVEKTIATYQAKLDEAGYQKVLAEAQKQYNAWK